MQLALVLAAHVVLDGVAVNNISAALLPQSAGSTKEEKDKGKKGKKGKGKEEPVRKLAAQKQHQKARNVETAGKKAEQGGGEEEEEEKRQPGEEGGAAEQEDKVMKGFSMCMYNI